MDYKKYTPTTIRTVEANALDQAVEEAVLADYLLTLNGQQTRQEQLEKLTIDDNDRGFNFPDGAKLPIILEAMRNNNGYIPFEYMDFIRERLSKYARQIAFLKNIQVFDRLDTGWIWEDGGAVPKEYRDILYADDTRYSIRSIEIKDHNVESSPKFGTYIVKDEVTEASGRLDNEPVRKNDIPCKTNGGLTCTVREYMDWTNRKSELRRIYIVM